jgi:RNA polymerase sigma-70 factor (ECF subfamily)
MATQTLPRQQARIAGFVDCLPATHVVPAERVKEVYEQNKHRIYSLAFWMTDNELEAEELSVSTFEKVFLTSVKPTAEQIDRALIAQLRESRPIGVLTLICDQAKEVHQVRTNTMRVHLERAVVQLPATERLIFLLHDVERRDHPSIARLVGLSEAESINGLHQARLRIRELLAAMI